MTVLEHIHLVRPLLVKRRNAQHFWHVRLAAGFPVANLSLPGLTSIRSRLWSVKIWATSVWVFLPGLVLVGEAYVAGLI